MKQKNILFTDMDGTILFSDNGKTYFKESDLDAIKEFQQRENLIVINSGRALPWIVAPLEGYLLPDYMIAGTGSIIADMMAIMSTAIVIYFGEWIKSVIPINLIVLLLLVHVVYIGIRCYVKDWRIFLTAITYIYFHANVYYHISMKGGSI